MARPAIPTGGAPDITPGRLTVGEIERNFADLHPPLSKSEALIAADRCYFCFAAPCTAACPTGIDIRDGLQLECIGCSNCVDACDSIMRQIGRAEGLIRYDSHRGFLGEARRWLRPRLFLYLALALVGLGVVAGEGRAPPAVR